MNLQTTRAARATLGALTLASAFVLGGLPLTASAIKKCVDDKGVTHYGDPLPPQCEKAEVKELSEQGRIKKTIDRPLTAEEIRAREEDAIRRKDETRKEAEQQRRDRALLSTYGAEKEFDVSRDKALAVVDTRYKTAEARLKEIDDQMKKYNSELEFYKSGKGKEKSKDGKSAPSHLIESVERTKREREVTVDTIKKMDEEKKVLTAQFESDKQRWKDLKTGKANLKAEGKTYEPIKKAGDRGTVVCNGVEHTCRAGYMYACRGADSQGNIQVTMMTCK